MRNMIINLIYIYRSLAYNERERVKLQAKQNKYLLLSLWQRVSNQRLFISLPSMSIKIQKLASIETEQSTNITQLETYSVPTAPIRLNILLQGTADNEQINKFNEQAKKLYKYNVLSSCKYCGRTFNFQSLPAHLKGCDKKGNVQQKQNIRELPVKIPKTLVCCVCGQRFGTKSLKIHYSECIKKFKYEEFRKHKNEADRRPVPLFTAEDEDLIKNKDNWTEQEMQQFNERATQNYRENGMAQCDNCGRKFFQEQVEKHRKNCILINGVLGLGTKLVKKSKSQEVQKPRTLMCVICGRDYGLASITIHVERCENIFRRQQELKLKQERRSPARFPDERKQEFNLLQAQSWTLQKIQVYNQLASDIYSNKSLAKCYICQRSFFQDSLQKHLKNCETNLKDIRKLQKFKKEVDSKKNLFGQNFIEGVIEMNRQLNQYKQKETQKPKVLMCYLCGREYGLTSLKIHLPQCQIKQNFSQSSKTSELQSISNRINQRYKIQQAETWSSQQISRYNTEVYAIYKKQVLHECKYCHRTFYEQALKKHIRHCQKQATADAKKKKLKRAQTMGGCNRQKLKTQIDDSFDRIEGHDAISQVHSQREVVSEVSQQDEDSPKKQQIIIHQMQTEQVLQEVEFFVISLDQCNERCVQELTIEPI